MLFGNATCTTCWLFWVVLEGSQAPVGSSTPSCPQTRPDCPLLNGAVPVHDTDSCPGEVGTTILSSAAEAAGVVEVSATSAAVAAASAAPPAIRRRRRSGMCGPSDGAPPSVG